MVHRLPRPGDHQGVPGAGGQVTAPGGAAGPAEATGGCEGAAPFLTGADGRSCLSIKKKPRAWNLPVLTGFRNARYCAVRDFPW